MRSISSAFRGQAPGAGPPVQKEEEGSADHGVPSSFRPARGEQFRAGDARDEIRSRVATQGSRLLEKYVGEKRL